MTSLHNSKILLRICKKIDWEIVADSKYRNKICDNIQHVVNHATYHRRQVVTMLRQVGDSKLFPTDYVAFYRQ